MKLGIFLIIYVVSEFYLYKQKKNNKFQFRKLIIHSIIYLLFLSMLLIFKYEHLLLLIFIIMCISHFLIHILNHAIKGFIKNSTLSFIIEQLLHIGIIIISTLHINVNTNIFDNNIYIRVILSILLLGIPGNVIFKKLFSQFKPQDNDTFTTFKNAGATIGILERTLIYICIVNGLYTSIGLIFTAKSIARYKRISDEPAFSEYYLIGTLSSLLYTIIIYFTIFKIL